MTTLVGFIEGVGLVGPGITDWQSGARVLTGELPWSDTATIVPALKCLPSAERRRTGVPVRIAITAGLEAATHAGADAAQVPAIFSSSGGDGQNLHEICTALASGERQLSPTRFHNSVHNAPSGYWGIATGATAASNALCAYDASFGAGLLEALTQVHIEQRSVLLVAYDAQYPEPLRSARPIPDAFAVALVLAPARKAAALARLQVRLGHATADQLPQARLEALRREIPAARCLPLLVQLALHRSGTVVLDYLKPRSLIVEMQAWP
jgi:Beta-ketoacyl synthase, N-terminal domain